MFNCFSCAIYVLVNCRLVWYNNPILEGVPLFGGPPSEGGNVVEERKNSAARIRANNKYAAKAYDRINIAVSKGKKDIIQAHAEQQGQSVNAYINAAIDEKMCRDDVEAGTAVQCGDLDIAAVAEATGERVEDFLIRAIQEAAGAVGASLPSNGLKASRDAAKAIGEDINGFINRVIGKYVEQNNVAPPASDSSVEGAADGD